MARGRSPRSGSSGGGLDQPIAFRALTESDLPLLHHWLTLPHVTQWWGPPASWEAMQAEYRPRLLPPDGLPLDAPGAVSQYLSYTGGVSFGFIQAYRVMGGQEEGWWRDETDPCALGIDQFIGLEDRLGQGLGTTMVQAFVDWLFEDSRVTVVQADPKPDNERAIRCYRKAGFVEEGVVETPDGPARLMRRRRAVLAPRFDTGSCPRCGAPTEAIVCDRCRETDHPDWIGR